MQNVSEMGHHETKDSDFEVLCVFYFYSWLSSVDSLQCNQTSQRRSQVFKLGGVSFVKRRHDGTKVNTIL